MKLIEILAGARLVWGLLPLDLDAFDDFDPGLLDGRGSLSDLSDQLDRQLSLLSEGWISKLIRDTGGATPAAADPARFIPRLGRGEVVNTRPGPEGEAYRITHLAALPYCSPRSIEEWRCRACRNAGPGIDVLGVFRGPRFKGRSALLLDRRRREIVLTFRGSIPIQNWIQNIVYEFSSVPYANGAKVHFGFRETMEEMLGYVNRPLREALYRYPNYRLLVTGHSLGASIAILAASELQYRRLVPWNRMDIYTYGEPRTGNLAFARWLNAQPVRITRVVNKNDLVPHLLPTNLGFVHHATEMHIRNNRSRICSVRSLEDSACSLREFPDLSIINHNKAWDLALGLFAC